MKIGWFRKGSLDRQSRVERNTLGIVLLPLLGSAAVLLLEKLVAMTHLRAFFYIAASLRTPPRLHFWETVALFRSDLLWGFVLVPLGFCLLTVWLPARGRIFLATGAALVLQFVVVLEVLSFVTTGAFSSFALMAFAARWAIASHNTSFYPHPLATVALVIGDCLLIGLLCAIALIALKRNAHWLNRAVLLAFGLGTAAAVVAYLPRVPAMPWSNSLLEMTIDPALFEQGAHSNLNAQSVPQLLAAYRAAAHVPDPAPTAYTGAAKNYNVIVFVMESMSADAFDPAHDALDDMPNVRRLRDHSFLLERDYTSYPLTDDASFSIFTSLYVRMEHGILEHVVRLPGMIRSLDDNGYATAFYGFVWNVPSHHDINLLKSLGFSKVTAPPADSGLDAEGSETFFGPIHYVEGNDHRALRSLCADIHNWTAQHQRFAAAYFPEMGHDPYRDVGDKPLEPVLARGHALAVYQDAWLGELLDELERDGALDNTIIVLTGDHGVRYVAQPGRPYQPRFAFHGTLDDATIRVPGLVYVPGVLEQPVRISQPTSHIDLAPTVLDLLGIAEGRMLEQGMPVYSPAIAGRRLFLKMDFMGAAGYYEDGSYYSRSSMGLVYKSPTLHFDLRNMVRYDSPEARKVRAVLEAHDANQSALVSRVLAGQ